MKKTSIQTAALVIVAASLQSSMVSATVAFNNSFDNSPVTTQTCRDLYVRDTDYHAKPRTAKVSDRIYEEPRRDINDSIPRDLAQLVSTLNEARFDDGHLSIVDCVGGSSTTDVRLREFSLDHIHRQGNESRGWRLSAEAENDERHIIRVTKLQLPPQHAWVPNERGDGVIAEELIFHINNDNDANVGYYRRVRVTEVTRSGNDVLVKQRLSINDRFSELQTWTFRD